MSDETVALVAIGCLCVAAIGIFWLGWELLLQVMP